MGNGLVGMRSDWEASRQASAFYLLGKLGSVHRPVEDPGERTVVAYKGVVSEEVGEGEQRDQGTFYSAAEGWTLCASKGVQSFLFHFFPF